MSRGNERRRIVRDDADRARRLEWLRRTVETYHWRLHALCLMDNHDHLYMETPEPNLSAGMQHLNGSYTSYPAGVVAEAPGYAGPGSVTRAAERVEQAMGRIGKTLQKLERQLSNH